MCVLLNDGKLSHNVVAAFLATDAPIIQLVVIEGQYTGRGDDQRIKSICDGGMIINYTGYDFIMELLLLVVDRGDVVI